jgi:hypothetical protein
MPGDSPNTTSQVNAGVPFIAWFIAGAGDTASWPLCFDVLGSRRIYDRYDTSIFFFF